MDPILVWLVALSPGLLHPLLILAYWNRFDQRKQSIRTLLDHAAARTGSRRSRSEPWKGRLDLNLGSYVIPTFIASVLSMAAGLVMVSGAVPGVLPPVIAQFARSIPPAAVAGFAGAYVWGTYDLIGRFRILNLPANALHLVWFRLLLGPIFGSFVQAIFASSVGVPLIFALMAVPVSTLFNWIQDQARDKFQIPTEPVVAPGWERIQGLTPDTIERLKEADVASISHLANQDPIHLLRRTNFEWRNVLDMMDQANLALYAGPAMEKLRRRGIRGAIEMAILWDRLNGRDAGIRQMTEKLVADIAQDLETDEVSVKNLLLNLSEDPQVERIWTLWYDRSTPGEDASAQATWPGR
jgi:hypothetical protein